MEKMTPNYKTVYSDIISWIDFTDYGLETAAMSDAEKIRKVIDTCYAEKSCLPKCQKTVSEWLAGMPSSVNIPFFNCDIISIAKRWGSLPETSTKKQEDKICANWWDFVSTQIMKLDRKLNK
jgi:hypothetical protein